MCTQAKFLTLLIWAITSASLAYGADPKYDATKNTLTLPTITIGDRNYNNLIITIDKVTVISANSSSFVSGANALPAVCPEISLAKYNDIKTGMTLDQVNAALGCQYSNKGGLGDDYASSGYNYTTFAWLNGGDPLRTINVYFDKDAVQASPSVTRAGSSEKLYKEVFLPLSTVFTK